MDWSGMCELNRLLPLKSGQQVLACFRFTSAHFKMRTQTHCKAVRSRADRQHNQIGAGAAVMFAAGGRLFRSNLCARPKSCESSMLVLHTHSRARARNAQAGGRAGGTDSSRCERVCAEERRLWSTQIDHRVSAAAHGVEVRHVCTLCGRGHHWHHHQQQQQQQQQLTQCARCSA